MDNGTVLDILKQAKTSDVSEVFLADFAAFDKISNHDTIDI